MMTYRELASNVKSNRGILALLGTKPDNLTAKRKIKRDAFFEDPYFYNLARSEGFEPPTPWFEA